MVIIVPLPLITTLKKNTPPRLIAKGADQLAIQIKQIAQKHHICYFEMPKVANKLFRHIDLDQEITAEFFTRVAVALALAYKSKGKRLHSGNRNAP